MISSPLISMARVQTTFRDLVVCAACDEFPDASIARPSPRSGPRSFTR